MLAKLAIEEGMTVTYQAVRQAYVMLVSKAWSVCSPEDKLQTLQEIRAKIDKEG
jgi:hypothetical protein